ncbi:UDP-N-acetylmuramoyl-tripeptide--D-alanyl-D-alanine ligase [Lentibacillus sp. Marseille-P4043]|uniref:UDP-N-acetylmuramoyl-tripeptide--D-alanyl-D- alanine ligase n=1 Tax=Lentibacillus sp. Marseille-P4043 TaxID=2040293 RepID=UPI000D0AF25C|nr:UDP-N-acetylmuramoyl-tripeptide--D-alanyl-D-alanine ligase [Lentibacillus sp. Marseille-P4043]
MLFTTNWLTSFFTDFKGAALDAISIDAVTTDSRKETKKALFIPLVGENFDGHDYVKQAFDNGAVAVMWNKQKDLPTFLPTDFPVFFVDDTQKALQTLAAAYREEVNPIVIGITGSNGKTTTKDVTAAVMASTYRTHYTEGNFNNHIGLPLTVLSMPNETEVLVLEMGMNHFGEIEELSKLAKPDYAIITNIGESHIEYLGSREGIAKAKLEITQGLKQDGYLIIDGDEDLLQPLDKKLNVITCGFHRNNDVVIEQSTINQDETVFVLSDGYEYKIPLLGKHHAKNATYAITLASQLGISREVIIQALRTLELTSMRFEMLTGTNGVSVINDAYNASPTSMKAAIEVVKQMAGFNEKVLILGDMFELGQQADDLHQSVAAVIDDSITAVFTFGEKAALISQTVNRENTSIDCNHFTTRKELTDAIEGYLKPESLLLFKASRGMQFESFVNAIIHP